MLKDLLNAIVRLVTFHGVDELRYLRHTYSPLSPWRKATDRVIEEAKQEAGRYGISASPERRRAYQVARMLVANRAGEHLADLVPDAYMAFSPPSAATYHAGRRSYEPPADRAAAFRRHPQTLAYLLTPARLARAGAGASATDSVGVIGTGESLDLETVTRRLHDQLGGRASSGDLRAYGEILLRLHAGVPEPENAGADDETESAAA
jgi:hypothetical protein